MLDIFLQEIYLRIMAMSREGIPFNYLVLLFFFFQKNNFTLYLSNCDND